MKFWQSAQSGNRWAGRALQQRVVQKPAASYLKRAFPRSARFRIAIYYETDRISQTQVYPFLHYEHHLHARHQAAVRCYPVKPLLEGQRPQAEVPDLILLQIWFDASEAQIRRALDTLRAAYPQATIAFVDSFAHNDLRLGRFLDEHIDFYLKKSLYRDREYYFRPFRGDTQLTEYYSDLYGIHAEEVDWQVPPSLVPKLQLSPNFFTAPQFLTAFPYPPRLDWKARTLDIQTRLGVRGSPWYEAMRQDAITRVRNISGVSVSGTENVSWNAYMAEMRQARLCFSPFGYGPLCWRDIEAIVSGAVLIKPDMGHLETLPDLYEAGVTYLPIRWDFADLEEVVTTALRNPEECQAIADEAYRRVEDYALSDRFVDDMAFLLPVGR